MVREIKVKICRQVSRRGKKMPTIYRSLLFVVCAIISNTFCESEILQEKTIGFITVKGTEDFRSIFHKGVNIYDKPFGQISGKITFDLNDSLRGYTISNAKGNKSIDFPYMQHLECYAEHLPVTNKNGAFYRVPCGWIKLPDSCEYVSWFNFYSKPIDIVPNTYSYRSNFNLILKESPSSLDSNFMVSNKEVISPEFKSITTRGKFIYIIAVKKDVALVAISKEDYYCNDPFITGTIGWIRIIDKSGHPLIFNYAGCC
jgi:hypothetical protein